MTSYDNAAAYRAARSDIARLLDVLDMHLATNDEAHAKRPQDSGITGNLRKARADLIDLVAFMAGMEPEDVRRFLDDSSD